MLPPLKLDRPMRLHEANRSSLSSEPIELSLAKMRILVADLVGQASGSPDGIAFTAAKAASIHLAAAGRAVRARLALHAATACGLCQADGVALAAVAELLHNASLVHDDIQDQTELRRGRNAIWVTFGAEVAVCAGDLLISAAYAALAGVSDTTKLPDLLLLIHQRVSAAIRGQCADLHDAAAGEGDLSRYEAIAAAKSGALLSLPLEMVFTAAALGGLALQARVAAERFAIGYQIADDIDDLEHDATAQRGALNIVLLLGTGDAALRKARWMAQQHLRAAASATLDLPHGAGSLLRAMALQLSDTLAPVAAP